MVFFLSHNASWLSLFVLGGAAYLVGSIPFGLVVGYLLKGVDLRQIGSGNIGAANALRALGPAGGALVLLLDSLKGTLPVMLTGAWFAASQHVYSPSAGTAEVFVGLCAIVGHNNSLYLGFKGGKGIATMFGVLLALSGSATLFAVLTWGVVFLLTRYASLSSLSAATSIPLFFICTRAPAAYVAFGVVACGLAFVRHRTNIKNLLSGNEQRLAHGRDSSIPPG